LDTDKACAAIQTLAVAGRDFKGSSGRSLSRRTPVCAAGLLGAPLRTICFEVILCRQVWSQSAAWRPRSMGWCRWWWHGKPKQAAFANHHRCSPKH